MTPMCSGSLTLGFGGRPHSGPSAATDCWMATFAATSPSPLCPRRSTSTPLHPIAARSVLPHGCSQATDLARRVSALRIAEVGDLITQPLRVPEAAPRVHSLAQWPPLYLRCDKPKHWKKVSNIYVSLKSSGEQTNEWGRA